MADALAAREQRVGELLDLHAGVALDVLEPFGRVARGVLDLQHFDAAARLVTLQHGVQVGDGAAVLRMAAELVGQVDGILQGELGATADGKVCGVGGIAHQHDGNTSGAIRRRAGPIGVRHLLPVHPGAADHAREADPVGRTAQVPGIAHERVAVEVLGKQPLAEGDAPLLAHLVDAVRLPHRFGCLDNEGGGVGVELVGVRLEPAMLGLLEGKGEGVEGLLRAQPHEAAQARVDVGLEGRFVACADAAVEAVAGDHEVGVVLPCQGLVVGDLGLENEVHAQLVAAVLQDVEQALAADADEAVAAGAHAAALEEHLDVVPVVERVAHGLGRGRVGALQIAQRLVREHHTPAEGVVGPVALDHGHLQRRETALHEQAEIQARGASADAQDAPQRRV